MISRFPEYIGFHYTTTSQHTAQTMSINQVNEHCLPEYSLTLQTHIHPQPSL